MCAREGGWVGGCWVGVRVDHIVCREDTKSTKSNIIIHIGCVVVCVCSGGVDSDRRGLGC